MLSSVVGAVLLLASGIHANYPIQKYKSTDLAATTVEATNHSGPLAPGYLFLSPRTGNKNTIADGPQILTQDGELVWQVSQTKAIAGPHSATRIANGQNRRLPNTPSGAGANFGTQSFGGKSYLTWWQGDGASNFGFGYGSVVFLDQTYTKVYTVCLSDLNIRRLPGIVTQPCLLDLHESRVTPSGTLLATVRNVTTADLSSIGGSKNGWVLDSLFVEVDIPTSKIIKLWSAVDHLDQLNFFKISVTPPGKTGNSPTNPWDFMHMNSVASTAAPQAGYIFSARYLNSAIKLDTNGNVQWFIQGDGPYRGGNFSLDASATFRYEHDIVSSNETATGLQLTMFDNNNIGGGTQPSSGLHLSVNTVSKQANLVQRFNPPKEITSQATGSYQTLPYGNVLVDYGHPAVLNEWNAAGNLLWEAKVGGSEYRAYKSPWVGNPTSKPSVAAIYDLKKKTTKAYVSWNGATSVDHWIISAGAKAGNVKQLATVYPKTGFETTAPLSSLYRFVQATAFDVDGNQLATSDVVAAKLFTAS